MKNILKILKICSVIIAIFLMATEGYIYLYERETEYHNASISRDFEKVNIVDKNLSLRYKDGRTKTIDLPYRVLNEDEFTLVADLKKYGKPNGKTLYFDNFFCDFTCYLDGKKIYEYEAPKSKILRDGGFNIHFIDLPNDSDNYILEFKIKQLIKEDPDLLLVEMSYANRINLFNHYGLRKELPTLIVLIALFIIFLVCVAAFIYGLFKEGKNKTVLSIGLLALILFMYTLPYMWTVNYIFHDSSILLSVTFYIALAFAPIPVLNIIDNGLDPKFDKTIEISLAFAHLNAILQMLNLYLNWFSMPELVGISAVMIMSTVIITFTAVIFTDGKKYVSKNILLVSLLPTWIVSLLAVTIHFMQMNLSFYDILIAGDGLFIVIQLIFAIRVYLITKESELRNQIYKEMATKDIMTNIGNRTAYAEFLQEVIKGSATKFWIVIIDLNDLKIVNDTYGHTYGDMLISTFAKYLRKEMSDIYCDKIYRIGGDEFVVFLEKDKDFDVQGKADQLKKNSPVIDCNGNDYKISFALGYAFYDKQINPDIDKVISEVDKKMYEDKQISKNVTRRRAGRSKL